MNMSELSKSLAERIDCLDEKLLSLATGKKTEDVDYSSKTSSYDRLLEIGSRIKYLIDSPETIYGFLDTGEFLQAAQRYVSAVEVHRYFTARHSKSTARRFPLLKHQWPIVKKLGSESWDRIVQWLSSQESFTTQQLGDALAALALLRPIDGVDILKHYLASRGNYISKALKLPAEEGINLFSNIDLLGTTLAKVVSLICTTIAQCGELFSTRPGVIRGYVVLHTLNNCETRAAELLFSTTDSNSSNRSMEVTWKHQQEAASERIGSLSTAGVSLECSQWLQDFTTQMKSLVHKLLENCLSGSDLATTERTIKKMLDEWFYVLHGMEDSEKLKWLDACQWVLSHPVDLWSAIFEEEFITRAKCLIENQFQNVLGETKQAIDDINELCTHIPSSLPGTRYSDEWREQIEFKVPERNGISKHVPLADLLASKKALKEENRDHFFFDVKWWMPYVENLLSDIDKRLETAVHIVIDVEKDRLESLDSEMAKQKRISSTSAASSRHLILNKFIHDSASLLVENSVTFFESYINQNLSLDQGLGNPGLSTAAIIIGHLASGLATRIPRLHLLLSEPSSWTADMLCKEFGKHFTGFKQDSFGNSQIGDGELFFQPKSEAARQKLIEVAGSAYNIWSSWASNGLAEQFLQVCLEDEVFFSNSTIPSHGWEQISVEIADESDNLVKFYLPAHPSPAMMQIMEQACTEIERAGGINVDFVAKQQLQDRISSGIPLQLRTILNAEDRDSMSVSEKGLLQLIFDSYFALGILEKESTVKENIPGRQAKPRGKLSDMVEDLCSQIDPIDWESFEPHLRTNVMKSLKRCQVLLGMIMVRRSKDIDDTKIDIQSSITPKQSSILHLANSKTRFTYLPVTVPSNSNYRKPSSGKAMAALKLPSPSQLIQNGAAADYNFSKLEINRPVRTASSQQEMERIGKEYKKNAGALEAFRSSKFGSMFSERASELGLASLGEYASGTFTGRALSSLQLPSFGGR